MPLSITVKLKRPLAYPGEPLPGLEPFLLNFGAGLALSLFPLMKSLTTAQLKDLADRAHHLNPNYIPPTGHTGAKPSPPPGVDPYELVKAASVLPVVENAYVMRLAPPPSSLVQPYLGRARKGINAKYVREHYAGGEGAGIGFADIEQGWNLNHADLPEGIPLWGDNATNFAHGTNVLGVVLMADNGFGGIGVAPSANGRVYSQVQSGVPNTALAIATAALNLAAGDVMLLEVQEYAPYPLKSVALMPAEVLEGNYHAIQEAVNAGIVVVEAAANNFMKLDTYPDASGKTIFAVGSADDQKSGAIMVAAATPDVPHTPVPSSNYGSRIDCFAWGLDVATTDTDATGKDNGMYKDDFGDTSSASAIIAGAALVVQGLAQANNLGPEANHRFSPAALLDKLKIGATDSANGTTDGIGVMPNLRKIATHLGVPLKA